MSDMALEQDNRLRASILSDALPYVRHYSGKIVVVKYGGAAMQSEALKQAVMSDIVLLSLIGIKIVLVHGGGPEINELLKKTGKQPQFIDGLRYTDEETINAVQMVLCGKINKDLVQLLGTHGGSAIGLCGLDGNLLTARRLDEKYGLVGDVTGVDPGIVKSALNNGYIPVIATVAKGEKSDSDGKVLNINADVAAAHIAAAIGASNLILMTDVRGLLRDRNDESTLIHTVPLSDVQRLKNDGVIAGGMIPKVECCVEAVRKGVSKANIIDGRIPHSILIELLTNEGAGTMFVSAKAADVILGL
jgi:acetylglutamate kinase